MALLSKLTSRCLKAAGIGFASLFIALPITAQSADAQSIAEIASSNDSFDVLTSLLEEAGWVEAFDGSNGKEFTVFAPTDEAFSRLPAETLESLYEPENRETLYDVLAYHVIGGSVTSDQLSSGVVDSKAGGLPLQVEVGEQIMINDATVSTADITATNGVIHVIDMVLIPQR
ncbi:fasciclin domain-containing protein [Leptolyngbya cf. ectocarpi LEGE 11479]|uniref:Fasciclin domain-containing protein n=1 Tax=Leptolyngbya cf. ectocarpi LEGE 11479 TaxID=1828722 RepID=A0A928ZR25_LEPEC|nr:fasciclin domain-containing protein [Leptolyngbya ectocarpi]MBE9066073.1 fasciclin domain-containing protein [Leptolyngbya cf. ectocarpi LEGE 11479]